jgi:hypothetical protein
MGTYQEIAMNDKEGMRLLREGYGHELDLHNPHLASAEFTGAHFEKYKNVFAHSRVDDRIDVEGKAGTLIQEIQSDWNLAVRQQGKRRNPVDITELKRRVADGENEMRKTLETFNEHAITFRGTSEPIRNIYDSTDAL